MGLTIQSFVELVLLTKKVLRYPVTFFLKSNKHKKQPT
ncbi:hypothetical protein ADICYQ_2265 [Cyclobacterium qasimii M12-11B]|uniref:Uncharacterized protein n=1 Tax=Cyclobacterium qasimii M12-11B TaxID=641524 RepID=S7WQ36_9BACT|nr:hypothetical protein ADICYQ_2265 [Cyclobacterium qasimii M12-11B]